MPRAPKYPPTTKFYTLFRADCGPEGIEHGTLCHMSYDQVKAELMAHAMVEAVYTKYELLGTVPASDINAIHALNAKHGVRGTHLVNNR